MEAGAGGVGEGEVVVVTLFGWVKRYVFLFYCGFSFLGLREPCNERSGLEWSGFFLEYHVHS